MYNLANLLSRQGRDREAEAFYRRASDAGDDSVTYNLAIGLVNRGELAEAEQLYRVAIDRGVTEALTNLGGVLVRRVAYAEAVPLLQAAESGDSTATFNLSGLPRQLGHCGT